MSPLLFLHTMPPSVGQQIEGAAGGQKPMQHEAGSPLASLQTVAPGAQHCPVLPRQVSPEAQQWTAPLASVQATGAEAVQTGLHCPAAQVPGWLSTVVQLPFSFALEKPHCPP